MYLQYDTICAISTPSGIGGISIIRLSGNESVKILKKIFPSFPEKFESHKLYYGFITDNFTNEELDEVLVSVMKSPKSYTKEDIVEINCHGGYTVAKEILNLLIKNKARLAEPGEFTKRAFLNGRIDLSQAEATIEVINAKNRRALNISENKLKGFFKEKIIAIKEKIINVLSLIESNLDFFEDTELVEQKNIVKSLREISDEISNVLKSYDKVKKYYQGINLVIAGPPNAGKSSLLNHILKQERAIISKIPGTTRDTIEEEIFINDIPVKVVDTAGIRDTSDEIEAEGVKRALKKIEEADIVLYLFDVNIGIKAPDKRFLKSLKKKEHILIGNKIDLLNKNNRCIKTVSRFDFFPVSIKHEINLEKLEKFIYEKITETDNFKNDELIITNIRHLNIFKAFKEKIEYAISGFLQNKPLDMICFDLNDAVTELEKLTGEITTEDILEQIFSNFCIGK